MTLPYVPCGHFALSTLSETCCKEPIFDRNVKKYITKNLQNPKMSILTPKSKIVSELDIVLSQLTHFDIRQFNFFESCHHPAENLFLVVLLTRH